MAASKSLVSSEALRLDTARALVLLAPFGASDGWGAQPRRLASAGHWVHTIEASPEVDPEREAARLNAHFAGAGIARVVVMTLGAVAPIALAWARANPSRVEAVALVGPRIHEGDVSRWAPDIHAPILVVAGERDVALDIEAARRLRCAFERGRLTIVADAARDVPRERSHTCTDAIIEWLNDVPCLTRVPLSVE